MADDIKTPEEINQATQALDKYIEKLKELKINFKLFFIFEINSRLFYFQ